jgi:hypothetical protein
MLGEGMSRRARLWQQFFLAVTMLGFAFIFFLKLLPLFRH